MWKRLVASPVFTHLGILVLAVCATVLYMAWTRPPPPGQSTVYIGKVPPKAKIKERIVPGPIQIGYIDKPALSASLKFPELESLSDNVIAVAEVAPSRGKRTAIATIGLDSDNVARGRILLRDEPVPLFGWEREWHGGLWYGIVGREKVRGEIEFLPMRVGPAYPSVKGAGSVDSDGEIRGQILLGVRF